MLKRMLLMLALVIALLGGLGLVKYRQFQAFKVQGASFAPPPTFHFTMTMAFG